MSKKWMKKWKCPLCSRCQKASDQFRLNWKGTMSVVDHASSFHMKSAGFGYWPCPCGVVSKSPGGAAQHYATHTEEFNNYLVLWSLGNVGS